MRAWRGTRILLASSSSKSLLCPSFIFPWAPDWSPQLLRYAENGSLGQTLKAFGKLNERLVASYVVKILEGLHYLHQSDVVHCDLKAANILTTKNGNVKLSDFGVSLNLRAMEREMKDVAGTPNWMAPEVIELKGASPKSDIWSLGCTVIELLTGRPPYADIGNGMSGETKLQWAFAVDANLSCEQSCSASWKTPNLPFQRQFRRSWTTS